MYKCINLELAVAGSQPSLTMQWNLLPAPQPLPVSPGYIQPLGSILNQAKLLWPSHGFPLSTLSSFHFFPPLMGPYTSAVHHSEPHLPFYVFMLPLTVTLNSSSLKIPDPTVSLSSFVDA